jgi:LmbE family N-acetylglucosaminyl deacetylase/tetratricopeptide (TPR) repeat protein
MLMRLFLAVFILITALTVNAAAVTLAELENTALAQPSSSEHWDRYGMALAHAKRFSEAKSALNHALGVAGSNRKQVESHLALVLAWNGQYKESASRYEQILQRYPRDAAIRIDYGQVLAWDKRYGDARLQYEQVLAVEPRNIEASRHLAILLAWQGIYPEALTLLELGLKLAPDNIRLAADRAEVLSWKGDLSEAISAYESLVKRAPDNAEYWLKLAQGNAWQGRTRVARESFEQVLKLDAGNIEAYVGLSHVYSDNHQFKDAEKTLRDALSRFPNNPQLKKEISALAAGQSMQLKELAERVEPLFFIAILLVLSRHIWRYRRVLRRRHLTTRILLPLLPTLAVLIALVYAFVLIGGAYYREISAASQLLQIIALLTLLMLTLTLVWLLRFEKPQRQQVILAIGAHPDDIEFGCGASLVRLREEGSQTFGLILTSGEKGHEDNATDSVRIEEARAAAKIMELTEISFLNFPDTRLQEHKEAIRNAIEQAIARWQPDIIFTHNGHDVHADHRTVHEATREAARGACTLLCYENPNTPPAFNPQYFIEVSEYVEDKIRALQRHKSQMGKSYADASVVRATAAFRGTQARVSLAEGFETVRILDKANI